MRELQEAWLFNECRQQVKTAAANAAAKETTIELSDSERAMVDRL